MRVSLTVAEVEIARQLDMTPVQYAQEKIARDREYARRRAAALKGWVTRRARKAENAG